MLTVRRILFPTDFSAVSHRAGQVAADMARKFGAALHVVHVRPSALDDAVSSGLAAAVTDLGPGLTVTSATLFGLPARQIVACAERAGVDLIVMGTHGRTGVTHALLGSVAEGVVRRASCPVLTIPVHEAAVVVEEPRTTADKCIVCAKPSPDLVCESCRTHIRGEALEGKLAQERPGRRGTSR